MSVVQVEGNFEFVHMQHCTRPEYNVIQLANDFIIYHYTVSL